MKKLAEQVAGIPCCFYLPDGYTGDSLKMPVIFFLLGLDFSLKDLEESLKFSAFFQKKEKSRKPFAVCAVDGQNSWYCNHHKGSLNWEDIFMKEFIKEVFQKKALCPLSCGIAGISMGGFGALHLGLKYPHIFQMIAGHSASLRFKREMQKALDNGREDIVQAFGNVEYYMNVHPINYIARSTHFHQYIWLDCGKDDFHIDNNVEFFMKAKDYLNHLEFHIFEGKHDNAYWTERLDAYLDYYEKTLHILWQSF